MIAETDVAAILRRLPVLPDRIETIESEARSILIIAGLAPIKDSLKNRKSGTKKAERELEKIGRRCLELAALLNNACSEAQAALEGQSKLLAIRRAENEAAMTFSTRDRTPHRSRMDDYLIGTAEMASAAIGELRDAPAVRHKGGQPEKQAAAEIARTVAGVYWRLTGNRPARSTLQDSSPGAKTAPGGEFYCTVVEIFNLFNIDGSADRYAREAIKKLPEV